MLPRGSDPFPSRKLSLNKIIRHHPSGLEISPRGTKLFRDLDDVPLKVELSGSSVIHMHKLTVDYVCLPQLLL